MEKIMGRLAPRWGLVGVCGVMMALALAGCGSSASAGGAKATATPTCPPARAAQTASGTISTVASGSITVAESTGTSVTVHLDANTRISKLVKAAASALTTGTRVQVVTDASVTTAQQIVIATGQGFGGGSGRGAGRGTPTARFNPACFQRQGQGAGQGGRFGLAGTVASVSSSQLVVNDAQGQALTVAITPATVIETTATGQASDLTVGASVLVTGLKASDGITARSITVLAAGTAGTAG